MPAGHCVGGGVGELRHPGRHLGEQGQEVPWTTDGSSLVPSEGHKATEKAEGAHSPGRLHPSIQLRRDQRDSSQREEMESQ